MQSDEPAWGPWQPMRLVQRSSFGDGQTRSVYQNDAYTASVYEQPIGTWWRCGPRGARCAKVCISRADGTSPIDWRDIQQIKSDVLGPEWEAVELYPAESRLIDPSNARLLWGFSGTVPVGVFSARRVLSPDQSIAPQRAFAEAVRENR